MLTGNSEIHLQLIELTFCARCCTPFSFRVWVGVASLVVLHMFVTMFDRNFAPSEKRDVPPPGLSSLQRMRHVLLRTKLLRRTRNAFFATAMGMLGSGSEDDQNVQGRHQRLMSTRQRLLLLIAMLFGLFLTLVYEAVRLYDSSSHEGRCISN